MILGTTQTFSFPCDIGSNRGVSPIVVIRDLNSATEFSHQSEVQRIGMNANMHVFIQEPPVGPAEDSAGQIFQGGADAVFNALDARAEPLRDLRGSLPKGTGSPRLQRRFANGGWKADPDTAQAIESALQDLGLFRIAEFSIDPI